MAVDSATGDLYIADPVNGVVEEVTPAGVLSVLAGVPGVHGLPVAGAATSSHLDQPYSVAVDSSTGDVFVADTFNDAVEEIASSSSA